jgi:hypothetical protein
LCHWHFFDKNSAHGLNVTSFDEKGVSRELTIYILDQVSTRERFPDEEQRLVPPYPGQIDEPRLRLITKFEQNGQPPRIQVGVFTPAPAGGSGFGPGFSMVSARIPWNIHGIFLGSSAAPSEQDIALFGELEAAKRLDDILPALRIIEPRLQKLGLVPTTDKPIIHGDIGMSRLVPIPFMGEGLRRVLSIVLAIANAPGGVVLIDEIENGLHYSVHKKVWQAIAVAARKNDVQVFATTHSWECIVAANESFSASDPFDLAVHRLDRRDQEIRAVSYDREALAAAMKHEMEVR